MVATIKRYLLASAGLVSTLVLVAKVIIDDYLPANSAGKNLATLSWGAISAYGMLLTGIGILFGLNVIQVFQSVANPDPVGFFLGKVASFKKKPDDAPDEYCLAQVLRTSNGTLEYRGVSKKVSGSRGVDKIDYCWWAEAWTHHSTTDLTRFIFRTEPGDIMIRAPEMEADTANIGIIIYNRSRGRLAGGNGTFFDFSLRGDLLRRKELALYDVTSHILKIDQEYFDEYVTGKRRDDLRECTMVKILAEVKHRVVASAIPAEDSGTRPRLPS